ncbi:T9SS type A sorting domain-containing protein [Aureivirga sp. CE67]|uniref:T9SS type A sorting domain-containing protein n=1 Tax=Aureivirga sp. CE67 TaxID=1788983 RepID=UPI0018C91229|nr:T9SS type A sorting domain-containing protein [Aureivirga sp. CE67]
MKKKLFFLGFILFYFSLFSQNQKKIEGKLFNLLDKTEISGCEITFYERNVSYTSNNLPILNKKTYEKPSFILKTNNNGTYSYTLNSHQVYYYLKIEKDGYETLFKDLYILENNNTIKVENFYLIPKVKNENEKENLEMILEKDFHQKNLEKSKDPITPPTFTQKRNTTNTDCTFEDIPETVYVQYLHNGYNGSNSNSGFTGYINFEEYIAGVVKAEIAGVTENLNVKKAQAIAARTYSMKKHIDGNPVNIGQAYNDTYDSGSLLSSTETKNEIILYNNEVITAIYGARCNGDYTQSAHEGVWSPYNSCNTSGNYVPYLISKPCSGHNNCSETNESPCCEVDNNNSNESGFIYGHGVGLCQRGIERWGEVFNLGYCEMLKKYYHEICISNTDCSSNSTLLDCENAITLNCNETYHGSSSNEPSYVSSYGCNNWTETGPERVHKFTSPSSGKLTATISNFSGDLDVYILGSCDPQDCLGEVYSSHAILNNAEAGKTYYIVVDSDDGSNSSYDLIVSCEELSIPNYESKIKIYPNPVNDLLFVESGNEIKSIKIYNVLGATFETTLNNNTIDVSNFNSGVYYLIIIDNKDAIKKFKFIKE